MHEPRTVCRAAHAESGSVSLDATSLLPSLALSHMRRRRTRFGPRGVPSPLSSDRRCCGVGAADDEDENGEP